MRTKIPKFQTKLFLRNGYDFLTEWNFVFTHRFSEISKLIQIINHIKAHSSYFTNFKTDHTFYSVQIKHKCTIEEDRAANQRSAFTFFHISAVYQ